MEDFQGADLNRLAKPEVIEAAVVRVGTVLADLLRALRVEASRRGVSEVDVYLADSTHRRVARAAGYRQPWTGAAYLFEKLL